MPTIRELLSKYKATDENPMIRIIHQNTLNETLANDLRSIEDSYPAIKLIVTLIKKVYVSNITYDLVVSTFDKYNIETLEDFNNWNESLKHAKLDLILSDFFPTPPSFTNLVEISYHDIKNFLINNLPQDFIESYFLSNNDRWKLPDNTYKIPTKEELENYIQFCKVNKFHYKPEDFDCDDFAAVFKCGLRKLGHGNLTVARIEINLYDQISNIIGAHAINLLVYMENGNKIIKLLEPQTGKIFNFGETSALTKYYKIRFLEM